MSTKSTYLEEISGQLEHVVSDGKLFFALWPLLNGEVQVDLLGEYGGEAAAVLAVHVAAESE